jgi:hypothetical protein
MVLRTRAGLVLAKVEATQGVAEVLNPDTDAIEAESANIEFDVNVVQTKGMTGTLDNATPIIGGQKAKMTIEVFLRGSGTPGTPPEVGPLLRACRRREVISTGTVPSGGAEACGAGGSTTTAELGASANAIAQSYRGMPLQLTTGQTLSTHIADYTANKIATLTDTAGGTIDADTNWQIPAHVRYLPTSTNTESISIAFYQDGLLWRLQGCVGTYTMEWTAGGAIRARFTFEGQHAGQPTDTPVPAATFPDTRPAIWRAGSFTIDAEQAAPTRLSMDAGNTVHTPSDPNKPDGYGLPLITECDATGSVDPQATLLADRNTYAKFRNQQPHIVHAAAGTAAGNRVAVTVPTAVSTGFGYGDASGLITENITFDCSGADAGDVLAFS